MQEVKSETTGLPASFSLNAAENYWYIRKKEAERKIDEKSRLGLTMYVDLYQERLNKAMYYINKIATAKKESRSHDTV